MTVTGGVAAPSGAPDGEVVISYPDPGAGFAGFWCTGWAACCRADVPESEQIRHARDLLTRPDNTVSSIARLLGVSRATIYKYVPEVTTERQAAALPPGRLRKTLPKKS